ncbi:hypothetical protein EVAR_8879_1 [Eumeta japonica]|uniref:Uncharacterized protein n=1 Tax=Eumeta variegata TaxID=151549 RepID=A0A4C1U0A3_EUMVA|nr:hypothetical protein EVAR_8879_1 [Eumeta japonica]
MEYAEDIVLVKNNASKLQRFYTFEWLKLKNTVYDHAINRDFSPTLDLNLGPVLDLEVPPVSNLHSASRLVYELDSATSQDSDLDEHNKTNLCYM